MSPVPLFPHHRRRATRRALHVIFALATLLGGFAGSTTALAEATNPSGLPLPRFATTRSTPINVRVGPGTRYGVAWVYVQAGTPVEIIQEFDTWRKIRDVDGSEGWVHQNLLSGKRAGIAVPWQPSEKVPLLSHRNDPSGVRAYLASGFRVDISECDGAWCEVSATSHPTTGHTATYRGFLPQSELWGVYKGEEFD